MQKAISIIVALVVGGGSFFGGMKYDQSKTSVSTRGNGSGNGNFGGGQGGGMMGRGNRGGGNGMMGGGFTNGEILSKDDKSVTLKLRDGGSKIIFFASSTQVLKADAGVIADLQIGQQVSANGSTNSDGSLTAQMIQIRPMFATSTQK